MVSNEEFAFTIGYDGPTAIVDKTACAQYGSLDPEALVEKGLFRAAYAKALRSGDESRIKAVMDSYNTLAGTSFSTREQFSRLLGVFLDSAPRAKKM
jgi:hypothetical protein